MAKKSSQTGEQKRAAILKELESVRKMLNEDLDGLDASHKASMENILESVEDVRKEVQQEFQIPLLDPGKSTTHELDFSKPKTPTPVYPEPEPEPEQEAEPDLDSIPTIDDISASSSLFDDEEDDEKVATKASRISQSQLRDHAQLLLQDLLNEAISEIEEKLDEWIPRLEIKLQKRLEKSIDDYIDKALGKL